MRICESKAVHDVSRKTPSVDPRHPMVPTNAPAATIKYDRHATLYFTTLYATLYDTRYTTLYDTIRHYTTLYDTRRDRGVIYTQIASILLIQETQ